MTREAGTHSPTTEARPPPVSPRRFRFFGGTRGALVVTVLLAVGALVSMLVAMPFLLSRYSSATSLDWDQLSAVSETYGAAATVLTALSLAGIALSLLFQARQNLLVREQAARTFHMDLVRMKLEDTDFLWAAGWPRPELRTPEERTPTRIRQHLYANLWIYYWLMRFEIGQLNEANLRSLLAREFFNGEVGRRYWESTASTFTVMHGRAQRRFFGIMEEEYVKATASATTPIPATGPPRRDRAHRWRPSSKTLRIAGLALTAVIAGGVAAGASAARIRSGETVSGDLR